MVPKQRQVPAEDVLGALLPRFLPWSIANGLTDNCCIYATRAGISVFKYFGISARPLAVGAELISASLVRQIADGRSPKDDTGYWHVDRCDPGARVVNIDPRKNTVPTANESDWNGHLVIYLPGQVDRLVDLSFLQFWRPEFSFPRGPRVHTIQDISDGRWVWILPGGDQLTMWETPDNRGWLRQDDWRGSTTQRIAIARLIKVVEKAL